MASERACDDLGLGKLAAELTGFSSRACQALAHLRDAWRIAGSGNRVSVEDAIRALLAGPMLLEKRHLAVVVLLHDLESDQKIRLSHALGLGVEVLGRGGGRSDG